LPTARANARSLEPRVVAQEMRVHVHDELAHVQRPEGIVHGDKGRRHTGSALEEASARHPLVPGQ
jgi:hypothetical protein